MTRCLSSIQQHSQCNQFHYYMYCRMYHKLKKVYHILQHTPIHNTFKYLVFALKSVQSVAVVHALQNVPHAENDISHFTRPTHSWYSFYYPFFAFLYSFYFKKSFSLLWNHLLNKLGTFIIKVQYRRNKHRVKI